MHWFMLPYLPYSPVELKEWPLDIVVIDYTVKVNSLPGDACLSLFRVFSPFLSMNCIPFMLPFLAWKFIALLRIVMLLLNGVWGCFDKKFNGLFVLLKSVAKLKDNMELHVIRTLRYYALQPERYFYGVSCVCLDTWCFESF